MTHTFISYLLMLCAGHALCDYPLQGDFLAKAKNKFLGKCSCGKEITHIKDQFWGCGPEVCDKNHWHRPMPSVIPYWQALLAHSLIHAGMVLLITNSVPMALLELGIHYLTDFAKCAGEITFNEDQAIHYGCKLAWALLVAWRDFA